MARQASKPGRLQTVAWASPTQDRAMSPTSLDKSKIRFLLLEGLHPSALQVLQAAGYSNIESLSGALPQAELIERLADVHFIGIRSRTQLNAEVLAHAKRVGTAGGKLASMVADPLITANIAAQQRGLSVLGAAGAR